MNIPRSTRLEPLQMVAEQREEEAMRHMAECRRLVEEHESRLLELQRYLLEYTAETTLISTPALISNRQAFLTKLRQAEIVQQQVLEQARMHSEAERTRWILKRRDKGVLEQLAASYRVQEKRHAERHEQKDMDELATQRGLRSIDPQRPHHLTR